MLFPAPKVYNMCATFSVESEGDINLQQIAAKCGNSEYNPKRFSAAIMRTKSPRSTTLIFRTGKIVVVGTHSENDLHLVSRKVLKKLYKLGICKNSMRQAVSINNIVASVSTHFRLNLESMNSLEGAQYEPDTFPALIYRMKNPKSTFLIFSNGKIVINGVKSEQEIHDAFSTLSQLIKKYRIMPKQKRKIYDRKQFILI